MERKGKERDQGTESKTNKINPRCARTKVLFCVLIFCYSLPAFSFSFPVFSLDFLFFFWWTEGRRQKGTEKQTEIERDDRKKETAHR